MSSAPSRFVLAVLAATMLWGTTGTVAHQAPAGSSQVVVGMSTFGFGGVLLVLRDVRAVAAAATHRATRTYALAGAVGVIGYAPLYYVSMQFVGIAVGNALALGSGPVWAVVFELVLERARLRRAQAAAMAITVGGVLLLASAAPAGPGGHPVAGVACALGAGCGYGLFSWAGARVIAHGHPSRAAMGAVFGLGAVVLVPALLVVGLGPLVEPKGVAILAYLAVLPLAAAYLLFGYGLRGLTASTATTLALAEPIVATVLAVLVVGERLAGDAWAGLAVIGAGLVLAAVVERRSARGTAVAQALERGL